MGLPEMVFRLTVLEPFRIIVTLIQRDFNPLRFNCQVRALSTVEVKRYCGSE